MADGSEHVLFTEGGRRLQLAVSGGSWLSGDRLLTEALPDSAVAPARLLALRRLADLRHHHTLRPELYPPDPRGARLALDAPPNSHCFSWKPRGAWASLSVTGRQ